MPPGLILVGRVAGPFGVRGELRLTSYTAEPAALLRYRDLKREDGSPALTLTAARPQKDALVARAVEVETREQAEALKGLRLYVPRSALPEPEEDEFYLADLIGLAAETEGGRGLGRVRAVEDHGAGTFLVLDGAGGAERLVPFTRAAVPVVDLAAGRLVVAPPAEVVAPPGEPGGEAA